MLLKRLLITLALIMVGTAQTALANDAAASTAMGGIQLKREARVAMLRERLSIGTAKVRVDYEFLNESEQDITTEVAFPIPKYTFDYSDFDDRGFGDFRVWVDGKELRYQVEVQATHKGVDVTALLRKHNVDAATFGHVDRKRLVTRDFQRLSPAARAELKAAGLIDSEDNLPHWALQKTYHWTQTFPAHKVVKVRHEYSPVVGYSQVHPDDIDSAIEAAQNGTSRQREPEDKVQSYADEPDVKLDWSWPDEVIEHACVNADIARRVRAEYEPKQRAAQAKDDSHISWLHWVDYILTTANTWKTPIKDFELIIDAPKNVYVSFCWDGEITRLDASHVRAHATDFVPNKELVVAYIEP